MTVPAREATSLARRLDRDSALPLWAQLHDDLHARLQAGEFGAAFPGELALAEQYEVSRQTVREAMRRLRQAGLVVAGRGRRPRLAQDVAIEAPLGAIYSLFASVEQAGLEQRSIVRALDVHADGVVAARLGLEESTPLLRLERLRLAGGAPLALDRVWLPASIAGPLLEADFTHTSLYAELADRCGVRLTGGTEHLHAVVPTDTERRLLGLDGSTAVLVIDRLGCAHGRPVEWRHTLVRGDRFSVRAEFSARTGYRLDLVSPSPRPDGDG